MAVIYNNNTEITTFINKAQNKIANLASLIVERGGDLPDSLTLLLELSDFIECLDNKFNNWSEEDILRWIHEYNQRANLNAIPFLLLTAFEQNILGSGTGLSLPITVADISDYIPATNTLIRATPHNVLSLLQGGNTTERYHLTLAELLWLQGQMNPFTAPTIDLSISPTDYQEKGTVLSTVNLQGVYNLNSGSSVLKYRYKRLGRVPSETLTEVVANPTITPYVSHEDVRVNTVFRFEVDFEMGGTKTTDKQINFVAPIWYGVTLKNKASADIQQLTKIVESPSNPRNFTFTLPSNNTTVASNLVQVPYILVSKSKGIPSNFNIQTFNTLPDWNITSTTALLQDGTQEPCWLCEFKNTVVGTFDCLVTWS